MTHALYRMYDSADRLLYVGITCNPGTRFTDHRKKKDWWNTVHRITMEHFSSRELLACAEVSAIKAEGPIHNIIHNTVEEWTGCGCEHCCDACWMMCCASQQEREIHLDIAEDLGMELVDCGLNDMELVDCGLNERIGT